LVFIDPLAELLALLFVERLEALLVIFFDFLVAISVAPGFEYPKCVACFP
jgi:hypothetical protein